jgi:hypothetical protein
MEFFKASLLLLLDAKEGEESQRWFGEALLMLLYRVAIPITRTEDQTFDLKTH